MNIVWFVFGLLAGGCIGTGVMSLFQFKRINEYEKQIRELKGNLNKN